VKRVTEIPRLFSNDSLRAIRFGACEGYLIALAVEADDEHRSPMAVAARLVRSEHRFISALGRDVTDTLAEAAVAELVGAAEELNGVVGIIRSQSGLHSAVVLIAKGQNVRPHAKRV
jgi:hypothetical protein